MRFYHFTCPWRYWGEDWQSHLPDTQEPTPVQIPLYDLMPSSEQYENGDLPARMTEPVVWLTTDGASCIPTPDEPNRLVLRLDLILPSTAGKLRNYRWWGHAFESLQLDEDSPDAALQRECRASWWVYRGIVPAGRVVGAELIRGQRPWWEVGEDPEGKLIAPALAALAAQRRGTLAQPLAA